MTDQQIRLHFGELNASEMRLARAIVGWHEAREAKLRAALSKASASLSAFLGFHAEALPLEAVRGLSELVREIQPLIKP